ncbi:transposase family protein [Streptomyces sp. NPDC047009]|uniref:helix-turn-helix domain-containing protein n=1 Tax=Streptomyces sp. NPDC047009 TaxID=3154496 RepID=UPI0033EF9285
MVYVVGNRARAAIIRSQRITGLAREVIAELVAEIGPLWHERHQESLASRPRRRAVGAGAKHKLVFVDRLLATLVHLRHGATHDVLACWFGVDRSTITRAIGERHPQPHALLPARCQRPSAASRSPLPATVNSWRQQPS